jgi:dolichyl-phosphate-mannose-protein mannosyltransferase
MPKWHVLMSIPELKYYDTITLKHKDTKVFLHSHPERYPLRYDDGRISSQGKHTSGILVLQMSMV